MKWETSVKQTAVSVGRMIIMMMMMIDSNAEIYIVLIQSYLAGNTPDYSHSLPVLSKRLFFANICLDICDSATLRDISPNLAPAICTVLVVGLFDIGDAVFLVWGNPVRTVEVSCCLCQTVPCSISILVRSLLHLFIFSQNYSVS